MQLISSNQKPIFFFLIVSVHLRFYLSRSRHIGHPHRLRVYAPMIHPFTIASSWQLCFGGNIRTRFKSFKFAHFSQKWVNQRRGLPERLQNPCELRHRFVTRLCTWRMFEITCAQTGWNSLLYHKTDTRWSSRSRTFNLG